MQPPGVSPVAVLNLLAGHPRLTASSAAPAGRASAHCNLGHQAHIGCVTVWSMVSQQWLPHVCSCRAYCETDVPTVATIDT